MGRRVGFGWGDGGWVGGGGGGFGAGARGLCGAGALGLCRAELRAAAGGAAGWGWARAAWVRVRVAVTFASVWGLRAVVGLRPECGGRSARWACRSSFAARRPPSPARRPPFVIPPSPLAPLPAPQKQRPPCPSRIRLAPGSCPPVRRSVGPPRPSSPPCRNSPRTHKRPPSSSRGAGWPGPRDSSVGGPMLWPANEPWTVCTIPDDLELSGQPSVAMMPVCAADAAGPWDPRRRPAPGPVVPQRPLEPSARAGRRQPGRDASRAAPGRTQGSACGGAADPRTT